ncbi:hypothetical protein [Clostridium hydrogenum]|uniref:hypothetical protein n=1 Tax=Clostridium hydrogenum TaxID=2855764 RepID=UPI001F4098A4|nr:hypothetical protein [Clostridium hydrogenum]
MKDIEKCLEVNIQALKDAGFIDDDEELSEKELSELRKVIKHAKCDNCLNEACTR